MISAGAVRQSLIERLVLSGRSKFIGLAKKVHWLSKESPWAWQSKRWVSAGHNELEVDTFVQFAGLIHLKHSTVVKKLRYHYIHTLNEGLETE